MQVSLVYFFVDGAFVQAVIKITGTLEASRFPLTNEKNLNSP